MFWVDPDMRGTLPLDGFRLSRSLGKVIRRGTFRATLNADFEGVLEGCAGRSETWINAPLACLYRTLHAAGHAHSLEVWSEGELAGGVYGVTLGGAFFGESMFSRRSDASKVALAYLVAMLRRDGFTLFDAQFLTGHLARLGAVEVPRRRYHAMLRQALGVRAELSPLVPDQAEVMHLRSQTS
jgi:leucyl/phenylalanyl-tRNA--protein transferase